MNKIVSDWDTLPQGVNVMTVISAVLTACVALGAVCNIYASDDFVLAIGYMVYYCTVSLIIPGLISRSARARGGRMLKWYVFAFVLGIFVPFFGAAAVVVYYMYFWRDKHPVTSTAKEALRRSLIS